MAVIFWENLKNFEILRGGDPLYNAAHLGLEQWNDIPDSSRIRF
jgi:hypothetical protein